MKMKVETRCFQLSATEEANKRMINRFWLEALEANEDARPLSQFVHRGIVYQSTVAPDYGEDEEPKEEPKPTHRPSPGMPSDAA